MAPERCCAKPWPSTSRGTTRRSSAPGRWARSGAVEETSRRRPRRCSRASGEGGGDPSPTPARSWPSWTLTTDITRPCGPSIWKPRTPGSFPGRSFRKSTTCSPPASVPARRRRGWRTLRTARSRKEWGRQADLGAAQAMDRRYRALRLGLVDATVIVVAERLRADAIATLDLRHFGAVNIREPARCCRGTPGEPSRGFPASASVHRGRQSFFSTLRIFSIERLMAVGACTDPQAAVHPRRAHLVHHLVAFLDRGEHRVPLPLDVRAERVQGVRQAGLGEHALARGDVIRQRHADSDGNDGEVDGHSHAGSRRRAPGDRRKSERRMAWPSAALRQGSGPRRNASILRLPAPGRCKISRDMAVRVRTSRRPGRSLAVRLILALLRGVGYAFAASIVVRRPAALDSAAHERCDGRAARSRRCSRGSPTPSTTAGCRGAASRNMRGSR